VLPAIRPYRRPWSSAADSPRPPEESPEIQLLADSAHMDIHRARLPVKLHAPQAGEKLLSRQRNIFIAHEHHQTVKLHGLKRNLCPAPRDQTAAGIDTHVPNPNALFFPLPAALENLLNPHKQLK